MNQPKKTALITGGNKGIGFELVKQLAEQNYQVLVGSRNRARGEKAAESLQSLGHDVHFVELDADRKESIQLAAEHVQQVYGRLDVLINNAGVYMDGNSPLLEADPDLLERTLKTNLIGPYHLIHFFLPLMKKQNYGRIVNVSSGYGQMDGMDEKGPGSYKLSKLALNGLTRQLAAEVSGNIKINAVCPGWVKTDMGGPHAPRTAEEAARSILWLAQLDEEGPNGGFFRDGKEIKW